MGCALVGEYTSWGVTLVGVCTSWRVYSLGRALVEVCTSWSALIGQVLSWFLLATDPLPIETRIAYIGLSRSVEFLELHCVI